MEIFVMIVPSSQALQRFTPEKYSYFIYEFEGQHIRHILPIPPQILQMILNNAKFEVIIDRNHFYSITRTMRKVSGENSNVSFFSKKKTGRKNQLQKFAKLNLIIIFNYYSNKYLTIWSYDCNPSIPACSLRQRFALISPTIASNFVVQQHIL